MEIKDIDSYIKEFDVSIQLKLNEIREIIKNIAPEAEEKISWAMPTFYLQGNLVHFAAHKGHIGFYPGVNGVIQFLKLSRAFKASKGGIQFPYDKKLPKEYIEKVVEYRIKENKEIADKKKK